MQDFGNIVIRKYDMHVHTLCAAYKLWCYEYRGEYTGDSLMFWLRLCWTLPVSILPWTITFLNCASSN